MTQKLKKIDKEICQDLRRQISNRLISLQNELGINIDIGNASYDNETVKFSFKVSLENAKSEDEKYLERDLQFRNRFDSEIKLDPNKIVNFGKFKATLVGFKPKARKKPYIIQNVNSDDKYVISTESCEKHFGIKN